MALLDKDVKLMIERIAEFFRFMCENQEKRLYYVLPLTRPPYAYQHSSIRDVATVCDILDLVQLYRMRGWDLDSRNLKLFEAVSGNTLEAYHTLYGQERVPHLPEGNIGDLGFYLLALLKCQGTFPSKLPLGWEKTKNWIVKELTSRQRPNGSLEIFFDKSLSPHEVSAESFYLPEALIGLIPLAKENFNVKVALQKAIAYLCQESNRRRHMAEDTATFYFNWQAQVLYHWVKTGPSPWRLESTHLQSLIETLPNTQIARTSFQNPVATVEVACYLEGLVYAKSACEILKIPINESFFSKEINRCLEFLLKIQSSALPFCHGGFVHGRGEREARIDVAGHVFSALQFL